MTSGHLSQLEKANFGLRSLVLGCEFDKSQRLSEIAVLKQLGISRTTLRQAMDRLVAEGLLERIKTGGCRVATFTKADKHYIQSTILQAARDLGDDLAQVGARLLNKHT